MAGTFYKGNELDTTTKEQLANKIINKITIQRIDSNAFDNPFNVFKKHELEAGNQIEEIETANLTSEDFDPTGAETLAKKDMNFKALYHKINREKTMKATVSDKQLSKASLSPANTASLANAIATEMSSSSQIEDYEAFKQLLKDIAHENKNMVICDLNENSTNVDAITKAIQILGTKMTFPSTQYNYSGFKKAFSRKNDLVLISDATMKARINVDSLAGAFNVDKKALVDNWIVIDEMPEIEFAGTATNKGLEIDIGEANKIIMHKYNEEGEETVTGKGIMILLDRRSIVDDPVERVITEQYNAKGRFTNKYLHATDILSYSTLKNAIILVD